MSAGEIATKAGDLPEVVRQIAVRAVTGEAVEHLDLVWRERQRRWSIWSDAVCHRHPEEPPAEHAHDRDQVDEPLRGPQPSLFGPASGFEDFVEDLDLPAHTVPSQLLDRILQPLNHQIGDEPPVDAWPVGRFVSLAGVKDGEVERGIALLLPDRRQDSDPFVTELQDGKLVLGDLDPVQSLDGYLGHFAGDGVVAVTSQAVDAGENRRLKKLLAESMLDVSALKDLLGRN
jgi:hypothetical protein